MKSRRLPYLRNSLWLQIEPLHTTPLVEFGDENVALFIKGHAVRGHQGPRSPLGGVGGVGADLVRVRIGTEYGDGFSRFIENDDLNRLSSQLFGCDHARPQLSDGGILAAN